ncbi:MAG: hypothetical protein JXA60_11675 [Candidatus Coatesbacteria bacterium]|nr:hypothetical protein [Candidatus Coatesbacteria bacterium]
MTKLLILLFIFSIYILSGCSKKEIEQKKVIPATSKKDELGEFLGREAVFFYPFAPVNTILPLDKYILIGSTGGVYKYDSKSIKRIKSPPDAVTCLFCSKGKVLIGTENSGLFELIDERILKRNADFPSGHVSAILASSNGNLFVGYDGLGIYVKNDGKIQNFSIKDRICDASITCIKDYWGKIIAGTRYQGLWKWENKNFSRFGIFPYSRINALYANGQYLTVCDENGIYSLDNDGKLYKWIYKAKNEVITCYYYPFIGTDRGFLNDRNDFGYINEICYWKGKLYAASDKGFLRQKSSSWAFLENENAIMDRSISSISCLHNKLIVSHLKGISYIDNSIVFNIEDKDKHKIEYCTVCSQDEDGTSFIGFLRNGWAYGKKNNLGFISECRLDEFPPSAQSIRKFDNKYYLVDRENIYEYENGSMKCILKSDVPLTDMAVVNKRILVGTYGYGLCELLSDGNLSYSIHPANKIRKALYIKSLFVDNLRKLWISSWKNGLYSLESDVPIKGNISVTSIAQSRDGSMWFGTFNEGIFCYKNDKWVQFKNDLVSNQISSVVFLENGSFAYSTYRHGLAIYYIKK